MRLFSGKVPIIAAEITQILKEEGDAHFRRISWEEANERAIAALKATDPKKFFFYASGRASNEANRERTGVPDRR